MKHQQLAATIGPYYAALWYGELDLILLCVSLLPQKMSIFHETRMKLFVSPHYLTILSAV